MRYINLILILLLAAVAMQAQNFSNTTPITIPGGAPETSSGPAAPYPSNITVSGVSGTVTKATVTLTNLNHGYPNDIDILLVGPTGASVILMSDTGGNLDLVNVNLTFDDAAAASLPDEGQIVSGTYKPTNIGTGDTFAAPAPAAPYGTTLSVFNGTNPNGTWSLYVMDDLGGDSGSIAGGWTLTLQSPTAASVSISGRVMTVNGRGLTNALVYLTDSEGNTRTARTSSFGYYQFSDIAAGQTVIITVVSKRYQFAQQALNVMEEINDVNFAALDLRREK